MGKTYTLSQPVFLSQASDARYPSLAIPGHSNHVPISLESYQQFGEAWQQDPKYVARFSYFENSNSYKLVGLLNSGTRVTVSKVEQVSDPMGKSLRVLVDIDEGEFQGQKAYLPYAFVGGCCLGKEPLQPDPDYLIPVNNAKRE